MFVCEECNYIWEEKQRYIGDPETTHCPNCGSAEIEETKLQKLPKADAYSLLAEVRADIQELLQMIADIPCICDKIYKDRGLRAPDCPRCNWIEEDIVKKVGEHFS